MKLEKVKDLEVGTIFCEVHDNVPKLNNPRILLESPHPDTYWTVGFGPDFSEYPPDELVYIMTPEEYEPKTCAKEG